VTVTGNKTNQREHNLNLTGYNWVRMNITLTKGSSGNDTADFNLDIYDASAGALDSWLFLGDSITAEGMTHANIGGGSWTGGDYAQLVHASVPAYYPVQIDGGIGGWTSDDGATNITGLMGNFSGHFVSLAFGTNDANEPYLLSTAQIQTYYSNMLTMIDAVQRAGDLAVVPYVPWGCNGDLGQNAQALNSYVNAHLSTDRPGAMRGPDLWTPFSQNHGWISSDCIHPTYTAAAGQLDGFEQYQRIWTQWAVANIYTPSNAPAATLSPTSLNLGSDAIGSASAAQTVTLRNTGLGPMSITGVSISGANAADFGQSNTCPSGTSSLAVGASCSITVTFTPSAEGSRSATLNVADNASGSPQAVPLSGIGLSPLASVSPTTLTFASTLIGATSAAQTVTLTNSGNAAIHVAAVTIGGANASDFGQTDTCPTGGAALAAGASCSINVTFAPTAAGARSALLQISDDAPGSPQSVAVSGTGATPAPAVHLSPSSLNFGATVIGVTSAAQTVTLANTGTAALNITSIAMGGANPADYAQTNTCLASLAAGASCAISVTFTPTATGARSASLSVTDNASGSPQSVALSGTGQTAPAPLMTLNPTSLNFGTVTAGSTSAAQTVTLTNSGTAALSINSVTLVGANPADFGQTNTCPASLAAGASCVISVTFTPAASASYSASVSVADNAVNSPQAVALAGAGTSATSLIFSDGFESGSLPSAWTGVTASSGDSVALNQAIFHSGAASLKVVKVAGKGGDAYIYDTFTDASAVVDARAYYNLSGFTGNGTLNILELDTSAGYYLGSIEVVGNAANLGAPPTLYWLDGGNYVEYACGNAPSLNTWHNIEIQDTISNTATGSFTLWVDGIQVCSKTGIMTAQQANARAGALLIGSIASDTSIGMTINVDDVAIASSRIGA
jgi:hypothetical protein